MARRSGSKVVADLSGLLRIPAAAEREAGREVRLATLDLLSEAVNRAPVDEGTLRGSGSAHFGGEQIMTGVQMGLPMEAGADPTPLEGGAGTDSLTGKVVFNTVYAAAQHEGVEFTHPKGGEAKYLERPANANREQYRRRIAAAVKRAVEGR